MVMYLLRRLRKDWRMKNAPKGSKRSGGKKGKSPYAKYGKTPYVYNKRAWRERWPHLASTIWDAQREGHNIEQLVYQRDTTRKESRYKELERVC